MDDSISKLPAEHPKLKLVTKIYNTFEEAGYSPAESFPMLLSMVSHFIATSYLENKEGTPVSKMIEDVAASLNRTTNKYVEYLEALND